MRSYKDLNLDYQGGNLILAFRNITSLDGCPIHIDGAFSCMSSGVTSLVGGPQTVDGDYFCENTDISDLMGCANYIGTGLVFNRTQITSLVGIHKIIKKCPIISFDAKKITEGGIGLLLIDHLTDISDDSKPFKIIKKYLGSGTKGMMDCSKELTAKGYAPYAKL